MFTTRRTAAGGLALALLWTAAPAAAHVAHTVRPGETLWGVALQDGLSPATLAAANGLPVGAHLVAGTPIQIPPIGRAPTVVAAVPAAAPPPAGAYTVVAGDTLGGIAARAGVSAAQVAFMNGLAPDAHVIAGTVLKLPTGTAAAAAPAAGPVARVVPNARPVATPGRVNPGDIAAIAAQHGVPPSLATAIAWQESGFNNGLVSGANARGVMQILPGTWSWVERNLAGRALNPYSPQENVHAGVLYLGQLLRDSGGDPATAVAGYYQGEGSVRQFGMLPETRRYVADVLALRQRFGG